MKNLKIGTRLTLGFGFVLLLLLILAAIGVWRMNGAQEASQRLEERRQLGDLIQRWARQVEVNASQTQAYGATSDPGMQKAFQRGMDESDKKAEAVRLELEPLLTIPDVQGLYQIIMARRDDYRKTRAEALDAQKNGRIDDVNMLFRVRLPSQIRNYVSSVDMLNEFQSDYVSGVSSDNIAANTLGLQLMGVATLLAFILGPLFAWFIIRSITRPLRVAVSAAETVARRDLSQSIEHAGRDETSLLLRALNTMSHNLRDAMGEVRSGANAIASAAAQISTGNLDLSSRTEEQASSLAQTAATMEQLTATVRQNADNTHQANTLAAAAAKVAAEGGTVVAQVVGTMGEISSKSKQVAAILGVIDSIAFQTNILALNAAVEAARAGEQGRGFAVVASEVRALAQRSATAAKEIKTLIDASVAATATGNEQAARAGKTMEEVVVGINRVTDIMGEISAASREQTTGIEEINSAVTQMDDVTRQNASLVEEAAAAAASLQDQAHTLEALVETFKLSQSAEAVSPSASSNVLSLPEKVVAGPARPARGPQEGAPAGARGRTPALQAPKGSATEEWTEF